MDPEYKFYTDVLGFKEFWRGSADGKTLSYVNLRVPDGTDYVEFMLMQEAPPPTKRGGAHHLCLGFPAFRMRWPNLRPSLTTKMSINARSWFTWVRTRSVRRTSTIRTERGLN